MVGADAAQLRIQRDFVDALERCDALRAEGDRQLLVNILSDAFREVVSLRGHVAARVQLLELVRFCCKQPEGLHTLVQVVQTLEPRAPECVVLSCLCDEWYAMKALPTEDWDRLREALLSVRLADEAADEMRVLRHAVRTATGSRVHELAAYCCSAWTGFVFMAGANAAPGGLPPAMIFLDCVAEQVADRSLASQLRRWNRRWAEKFEVTDRLDAAPWRSTQEDAKQISVVYLVIQLDPDPTDRDQFMLTHWRQWDASGWRPQRQPGVAVSRRDLEREIDRLISDLECELGTGLAKPQVGSIFLEFVVSWEMLNTPIEFWRKASMSSDTVPLAVDHPVVLRSLDRMRATRHHLAWRRRWGALSGQSVANRPYWSQPSGLEYFTRLAAELSANEHIVSMVLSEPPGDRDSVAWREVTMAFRAGIPAILWDREDCSGEEFREAVGAMLSDGELHQLPQRVAALRRDALRTSEPASRSRHAGRSIALLWDDPDRLPEPRSGPELGSG
ncbi:hypothetical protein F0L68_05510 [Solihabitans fulvus]|uniref:Uncharacterized protein n=1 Tax=Solihabitans fulvus TaxID=1892852 RepID=A0A5B2XN23_9PSEU|nr:hypothetical protein [Solihabitans fulvus]KAA2265117.1 hypothetical protein F0L68_05510 [Solihabitans fulvus]